MELPQFTSCERLEPVIARLSVVAVELLRLRQAARSPQARTQPASRVAPKRYVEVISAWRYRTVRELTVHEFYMAVARLGGHQNASTITRRAGWCCGEDGPNSKT